MPSSEEAVSSDMCNLKAMLTARHYNRALFREVAARAGTCTAVLDFGAGLGCFANRFAAPLVCVEPDGEAARHIAERHRTYRRIEDVGECFDFVYSMNVLEHIEDDFQALLELRRVLRPGGRLFLFLPARSEIFSAMDRFAGHFRRYDRRQMHELLTAAGFAVEGIRYFDFAGYWCTLAMIACTKIIGWKGKLTPSSISFYDRFVFRWSLMLDRCTCGDVIGKNIIVDAVKPAG